MFSTRFLTNFLMIFKAGLSLGLIWTCIYLKQWKTIYHDANFSFSRFQTSNLYRVDNIIKPYSTNQNIKNNAAGWICVTIFESSWLKYRSVGHGGVERAKPPQILKDHLTLSLPGRGKETNQTHHIAQDFQTFLRTCLE